MINVNDLVKKYNDGKENELTVLKGITLHIGKGEMVAILGASGSGKTTLLNTIGLIDSKFEGEVIIDSYKTNNMSEREKARVRNKMIGFVVQDFALIEKYTVYENIVVPLDYASPKIKKREKREKISNCLKEMKLLDKIDVPVCNLSGGQRQRVAIARAVINNPDIILADEPTGALDIASKDQIIDILTNLNKQGKTVVVITHDHEVAQRCGKMYHIFDGQIYSG